MSIHIYAKQNQPQTLFRNKLSPVRPRIVALLQMYKAYEIVTPRHNGTWCKREYAINVFIFLTMLYEYVCVCVSWITSCWRLK